MNKQKTITNWRLKPVISYQQQFVNTFFWRTKQQQEIDYIEERNGELFAYDFKWNPGAKTGFPKSFLKNYACKETSSVHRENFHDFLTESLISPDY